MIIATAAGRVKEGRHLELGGPASDPPDPPLAPLECIHRAEQLVPLGWLRRTFAGEAGLRRSPLSPRARVESDSRRSRSPLLLAVARSPVVNVARGTCAVSGADQGQHLVPLRFHRL